jgi:hypothetical protein
MDKHKYRGVFNVAGEVTELYRHARDKEEARRLFARALAGKYKRRIFINQTDHTITRTA